MTRIIRCVLRFAAVRERSTVVSPERRPIARTAVRRGANREQHGGRYGLRFSLVEHPFLLLVELPADSTLVCPGGLFNGVFAKQNHW